jgi:hypothetical protein
MSSSVRCRANRFAARHQASLALCFVSTSLLLSIGCTMTSDLDDLRRRAVAARLDLPTACEIDPTGPECELPTVMCSDNPSCTGYCDDDGACRPDACRDTLQSLSVGETGIDCGGQSCVPCSNGQACLQPTDCLSGNCENNMCVAMSTPIDEPDAGDGDATPSTPDAIDGGSEAGLPQEDCVDGCSCLSIGGIPRIFCSEMTLSWSGASSFCEMQGMLLTPIETRTENDALGSMAEWLQLTSFWIGASDRSEESDWDWTDGSNLWNGGPATCVENGVEGPDTHCYLATPTDNYERCYEDCLALGPGWSLTTIHSLDENNFVQQLIDSTALQRNAQYHNGWIGANDMATEGTWGWVLKDPDPSRVTPFWMGGAGGQKVNSMEFTNWNGSNPGGGGGENCASMSGNTGRWMDDSCGFDAYMGICEGPMRGPIEGTYHSFADSEPQVADCLSYNTLDFRWYAQDCALAKAFVCSGAPE